MKKYAESVLFLLFLILVTAGITGILYQRSAANGLLHVQPEEDNFRCINCTEDFLRTLVSLEVKSGLKTSEILTVLKAQATEDFRHIPDTCTKKELLYWKNILLKYNRSSYEKIKRAYGAIFDDLVCLPVMPSDSIIYENSWMFERYYGGKRGHEGTDLMPPQNLAGYYPVLSMTDGVVENIGWLEMGGYRIGIRSPSGGYFYYAHLDSYSRSYVVGDIIAAGEVIGWMGDTGYGKEGTRGMFDVHLHLGIYIRTEKAEELSVNPYWILKYLELKSG